MVLVYCRLGNPIYGDFATQTFLLLEEGATMARAAANPALVGPASVPPVATSPALVRLVAMKGAGTLHKKLPPLLFYSPFFYFLFFEVVRGASLNLMG